MGSSVDYLEWKEEHKRPGYRVYILTGSGHWKDELVASIRSKYKVSSKLLYGESDLEYEFKKLKYKPLGKDKHLAVYENPERMSKSHLRLVTNYIKNPSPHAIVVIHLENWINKKSILDRFKNIEGSQHVKYFDLSYPTTKFLKFYIDDMSNYYGVEYENNKAKNILLRRLRYDPSDIRGEIQFLSYLEKEVSVADVKDYIDSNEQYSYSKLYEVLTELNRVKVPYITYGDLIDSGRNPVTIIINLRKHFHYLYQAKYLKMNGYLWNDDVVSIKKKRYEKDGLQFEYSLFDMSKYQIDRYMDLSDSLTLSEILYVIGVIDKNMPKAYYQGFSTERGNEIMKNIRENYDIPRDEMSYRIVLDILARRGV